MSLIGKIKKYIYKKRDFDFNVKQANQRIKYSVEGLMDQIELQAIIDDKTKEATLEEALVLYCWARSVESDGYKVIAYKLQVEEGVFVKRSMRYAQLRPRAIRE